MNDALTARCAGATLAQHLPEPIEMQYRDDNARLGGTTDACSQASVAGHALPYHTVRFSVHRTYRNLYLRTLTYRNNWAIEALVLDEVSRGVLTLA
jgi:hypothetical protein